VIRIRVDDRFIRQIIGPVGPFICNGVRLLELIRVEYTMCCSY